MPHKIIHEKHRFRGSFRRFGLFGTEFLTSKWRRFFKLGTLLSSKRGTDAGCNVVLRWDAQRRPAIGVPHCCHLGSQIAHAECPRPTPHLHRRPPDGRGQDWTLPLWIWWLQKGQGPRSLAKVCKLAGPRFSDRSCQERKLPRWGKHPSHHGYSIVGWGMDGCSQQARDRLHNKISALIKDRAGLLAVGDIPTTLLGKGQQNSKHCTRQTLLEHGVDSQHKIAKQTNFFDQVCFTVSWSGVAVYGARNSRLKIRCTC